MNERASKWKGSYRHRCMVTIAHQSRAILSCPFPGGNVRGGASAGQTDEFGLRGIDDQVHIRDVHATILDLLGLDDEQLRYLHAGRLRRLTDIGGNVLEEVIA